MDEKLSISLKFYSLMGDICFFAKREMIPFAVCRMVQVRCSISDVWFSS